jgi:hypothetical protein
LPKAAHFTAKSYLRSTASQSPFRCAPFMRAITIIIALLTFTKILSQDNSDLPTTWNYFKEKNIPLNTLEVPKGYAVSYNCDSMLFVRGDFSDTIKIWTPGFEWTYNLEQFKEVSNKPDYGKTFFAKSILPDGRIVVDSYTETMFIFRRDSLFEVEDTISKPSEYFTMLVDHMFGKIDEVTFKRKKDSIDLLYNERHVYVPKLIFAKHMFQGGKKKIKLSRKVNYAEDEIELEQEWEENQKKCYVVRINNRSGKEKTSYAYIINEDIKFIRWEGCSNLNRK